MIGQSGCFGGGKPANNTIDNVEEASAVVDKMLAHTYSNFTSLDGGSTDEQMAKMQKRLRALTVAVVVLALLTIFDHSRIIFDF